jgi:hypothetical protein
LQPLLASAKLHYLGVNLKDGTEASDTLLVLDESAASYVGDSVGEAVRLILTCRAVARGVNFAGLKPIDAQQGQVALDIAFRDWAQFLRQEVFGTANEVAVSKTIDPKPQAHLDVKVLEGLRSRAEGLARAALAP